MVKWAVLAVLTLFISLGSYLYYHLGVYQEVKVELQDRKAMILVFKNHLGPYHTTHTTIEKVEAWAKQNGISCSTTFGEYIDDPSGSPDEDRLRSRGGCVMNSQPSSLPEGYLSATRPAGRYVVGQFSGSPAIGPYKVYPKAHNFMQDHRLKASGPVIELYQFVDNSIRVEYLFPVLTSPPIY